jgi:hypothetical protein
VKRNAAIHRLRKSRFFVFFPEIRRRLADGRRSSSNTCAARAKLKLRENLGTVDWRNSNADALFTRPSPPHEARGAHNAARRLFSAALARDRLGTRRRSAHTPGA